MRTLIFVSVVLAAVSGGVAFYTGGLVGEATRHAQTELAGFDNTPKLARADAMMVEDKDCFTCVKGSSKWVMDHVIDYIKAKCEETECPKLKEMCEKAAEHPEVTFGYLVAAVRPMSLGYAWCNGKGECGKDDQTVSDEALFIGESMDQLVESVEQDDSEVQLEIAEPEDALVADEEQEASKECKKCIKGVSKGFMWHVIGKIKKYCMTTDKPSVKKMCEAAEKHPKVAFGYLLYMLRPMEFAAGYCMGKGKCFHKAGCSMYHDEIMVELMDDDRMSLADDAAVFF